MNPQKAMVVLSGGQDSTTCLFWAIKKYGLENVHTITFDYGQRHRIEIDAAITVAKMAGIKEERRNVLYVANILLSTSPLLSDSELEQYENHEQMEEAVGNRVEKTFVPMRNTFFLTVAANYAIANGCNVVVTGICGEDNANYPDCTEPFRDNLQYAFNVSLGHTHDEPVIRIKAPLMFMTKAQSIELAKTLPGCMNALAYSHTSYDGQYPPTDKNHANILRAKGFEEAGIADPLVIRAFREGLMDLPGTANYDEYRCKA